MDRVRRQLVRARTSESYGYNNEKVLIRVLETLNDNRATVSINFTLLFNLSNQVLESRQEDLRPNAKRRREDQAVEAFH